MIGVATWVLTACINGNIICVRDANPSRLVHNDPEKSCYVEGVFYPRCKDFENPEVQRYHKLLKDQ